ncbi:unnamed protein product [Protopolystoma xenopodis]|uniref:Uncharacterized protein n=1 Tax=Protopolystoma xenopodis TaxID=117903 RepID=A0A448WYH9_9PLAT|nr:unnamed protein product [Protopolystoma xenopodis]
MESCSDHVAAGLLHTIQQSSLRRPPPSVSGETTSRIVAKQLFNRNAQPCHNISKKYRSLLLPLQRRFGIVSASPPPPSVSETTDTPHDPCTNWLHDESQHGRRSNGKTAIN